MPHAALHHLFPIAAIPINPPQCFASIYSFFLGWHVPPRCSPSSLRVGTSLPLGFYWKESLALLIELGIELPTDSGLPSLSRFRFPTVPHWLPNAASTLPFFLIEWLRQTAVDHLPCVCLLAAPGKSFHILPPTACRSFRQKTGSLQIYHALAHLGTRILRTPAILAFKAPLSPHTHLLLFSARPCLSLQPDDPPSPLHPTAAACRLPTSVLPCKLHR